MSSSSSGSSSAFASGSTTSASSSSSSDSSGGSPPGSASTACSRPRALLFHASLATLALLAEGHRGCSAGLVAVQRIHSQFPAPPKRKQGGGVSAQQPQGTLAHSVASAGTGAEAAQQPTSAGSSQTRRGSRPAGSTARARGSPAQIPRTCRPGRHLGHVSSAAQPLHRHATQRAAARPACVP